MISLNQPIVFSDENFTEKNYFGDSLAQDMMMEIMEFNDHLEILSSYCLISKSWFNACCLLRLNLDFSLKKIHPRYFERFFNAENVPRNITQLSLAFNALRDEQLIMLSQYKSLTSLDHLNLRNNSSLSEAVFDVLLASDIVKNLKVLKLRGTQINPESILNNSHNLKNLLELDIRAFYTGAYYPANEFIPEVISSLPNLRKANFRNRYIENSIQNSINCQNLTELDLQGCLNSENLESILNPTIQNLKVLNLRGCFFDVDAELIANCPHLSNLESLNISLVRLGGVKSIAHSPHLTNLTLLNIHIDPTDFKDFFDCKLFKLKNLKMLSFDFPNNGNIEVIAYCELLSCLRYLDLGYVEDLNPIFESPYLNITNLKAAFNKNLRPNKKMNNLRKFYSNSGLCATEMLQSEYMENLISLYLPNSNSFNLECITRNQHMRSLRELCLSNCQLQDNQMTAFENCENLNNLTSLNLSRNYINNGLIFLVQCPFFTKLEHLNLNGNDINDQSLSYIENLTLNLKYLGICSNQIITDIGISYICSCNFLQLTRMNIGRNNNLTDFSLGWIAMNPTMKYLNSLTVYSRKFTKTGAKYIIAHLKYLFKGNIQEFKSKIYDPPSQYRNGPTSRFKSFV